MIERASVFLDDRRLLRGPWQAFERDLARLLLANGFADVRMVGGTGDRGADVLGVQQGRLWVFQCKHTTTTPPPREAIGEVVEAGRHYNADLLFVACTRPPGEAFNAEKARYERTGLKIHIADPALLRKWMSDAPDYPPGRMTLRPYQEEASSRLREALLDTGRGQIVLATGLGKTVVMAEMIADLLRDSRIAGDRVLVLAHTVAIVEQLHRAFWYQLPKTVPTHQLADAEMPSFWDGITFATIQSVMSRLDELPRFGAIVVDEAHHIGSDTFRRSIAALDAPMLAGVTATPWRGDGYELDDLLGPPVFSMGIAEGLQRGFLSDVDYRLLADNLDWAFIQSQSKNRYSLSQLNDRLIIPTRDEEAARVIREAFEREQRHSGIVFCRTIDHANYFAAMLRKSGLRAEAISSDNPPRERDMLISQFKAGRYDLLTTVDLFNEGVDLPDVDLIVFMRVTHSRRIFVQQLGRGLRWTPHKDRVVVLDFVTDLHRVAEVVELDRAVRGGSVEQVGLGDRLVVFNNVSAGTYLREWMLDQASVVLREGDPAIQPPDLDFPRPRAPGSVQ